MIQPTSLQDAAIPTAIKRNLKEVQVADSTFTPCWVWQKSLNNAGYGQAKYRSKVWNVHRLVYHLLIERLPQPGKARDRDGRVLDHLCHNRPCANPYHLEAVSQSENTLRGDRHEGRSDQDQDPIAP